MTVRQRDYEVRGDTFADLVGELERRGPARFDAFTSWRVRWHFSFAPAAGGNCAIFGATVDAGVTITLPSWRAPASASDALRTAWRTYVDALVRHENGHRDLAARGATRILDAIRSTPRMPNCRRLEQAANAAARDVLRLVRGKERAYDARTNHGQTQGALFPQGA